MKLISILFSAFILFNFSIKPNCKILPIEEAVEQANIIAIGRVTGFFETPEYTLVDLEIQEQLYSNQPKNTFGLSIKQDSFVECPIDFKLDQTYLVYGVYVTEYYLETNKAYRTARIESAGYDLKYLYENLECSRDEVEKIACPRVLSPVCGCDRTTYSNACIAENSGISWWRQGKCR